MFDAYIAAPESPYMPSRDTFVGMAVALALEKRDWQTVRKYVAMYRPEDIVKRAWRDAKRGKDVSTYGFVARGQIALVKLLPHRLVMDIWMKQQRLP